MSIRATKLVAILASLFFAGCSTPQNGRLQDSAEFQKAAQVFGGTQNLHFLYVPSHGPLVNVMVSGLTAAHPSAMSKEIGRVVGLAHTQKVDFAVTGDSPMLTRMTVISGLEIQKGQHLSNLRVLYFGDESDRLAVEQAVKDVGGEFSFVAKGSL